MSSDLWAAFGSPPTLSQDPEDSKDTSKREIKNYSKQGDDSDHSEADSWTAVNEELENAWQGNDSADPFHSVSKLGTPAASQASNSKIPIAGEDDFGDFEEAEKEVSEATTQLARTKLAEPVAVTAIQYDEPDDFGDFAEPDSNAGSRSEPPSTGHLGSIDALQAFIDSQGAPYQSDDQAQPSPSLLDLRSPTTTNPTRPAAESDKGAPKPKKVTFREEPVLHAESDSDDSGNWADLGGSQATQKAPVRRSSEPLPEKDPQPSEKVPPRTNAPPPTNLPPPSVLMALVASLLGELPERIRVTIVETWEEDEADVKKYVDMLEVTARILAGRKLRWKRDTHLAQNMKIGMSGRPGGMKLAGVDRAELQREEREASELVRNWRQNLGVIRAALAESGTGTSSKPLALPLIAESIPVRTIKPEDGGIKAPRCCVICGLKREERAHKVDIDVWDQFGEWWTEHWGHTTCKAFWIEYESYLRRVS